MMMRPIWSLYGRNHPPAELPCLTSSQSSRKKKYDLVMRSEYANAAMTSSAKAISTACDASHDPTRSDRRRPRAPASAVITREA